MIVAGEHLDVGELNAQYSVTLFRESWSVECEVVEETITAKSFICRVHEANTDLLGSNDLYQILVSCRLNRHDQ